MQYFKNISSLDDLKSQFKALARKHHPDCGGDPEIMKAINQEYDQLFPIWKNKSNVHTAETAESTRSEFYTQNGWKGENYDSKRSLKEVSAIIRQYVRSTYPDWKFSVTKHDNALNVEIVGGPIAISKELLGSSIWKHRRADGSEYPAEVCQMADDINAKVNSYNFEDIDGQIDYFHVGFWFHGVGINYNYKVIEPKAKKATKASGKTTQQPDNTMLGDEYTITETVHTKTGETIWVVKCNRTLSREEYIQVANRMKSLGGYYSEFVHGFVFKADPTESLADIAA